MRRAQQPIRKRLPAQWALAVLCLGLLPAGAAHAFHNPALFFDDVIEGGGGGRFFTGSPADGFTCDVCHASTGQVPIAIRGLPEAGYTPGQTYLITVNWLQPYENVAFNAEITDDGGRTLGTLATPGMELLTPADLCKDIDAPATQVGPSRDGRSLVICGACEQQQGTFQWTAPPPGAGTAWFSGALLVSDLNGDALGDRVTVFSRVIPPQSGLPPDVVHIAGLQACTVGAATRTGPDRMALLGLVMLALWRVGRRRGPAHPRRRG